MRSVTQYFKNKHELDFQTITIIKNNAKVWMCHQITIYVF